MNNLYGSSVQTGDDYKIYTSRGLIVIAVFNSSNICQGVSYTRSSSEGSSAFSDEEVRSLDSENISAGIKSWQVISRQTDSELWAPKEMSDPNAKGSVWDFYLKAAYWQTNDGKIMPLRSYMTTEGLYLFTKLAASMRTLQAPTQTATDKAPVEDDEGAKGPVGSVNNPVQFNWNDPSAQQKWDDWKPSDPNGFYLDRNGQLQEKIMWQRYLPKDHRDL